MRVVKGKVVSGQVVVPRAKLANGEKVTVLLREEGDMQFTPKLIRLLNRALDDADAGRVIEGPEFVRDLARRIAALPRRTRGERQARRR